MCLFVNDNASAEIIDILADNGVRFIAMRCAGFDRVDIEHAHKRGIRIARVPTYSPASVAEHALALMLTLSRKLQLAVPRCRDGNYTVSGLTGWELASRNFGIVGTGAIGAVMARLCLVRELCMLLLLVCHCHCCQCCCWYRYHCYHCCCCCCSNHLLMSVLLTPPVCCDSTQFTTHALAHTCTSFTYNVSHHCNAIAQGFQKHTGEKPKVYAYDLFPRQDLIDAGVEYVDLDTLLAHSDIVSLHCPLLPSTFHLISEEK